MMNNNLYPEARQKLNANLHQANGHGFQTQVITPSAGYFQSFQSPLLGQPNDLSQHHTPMAGHTRQPTQVNNNHHQQQVASSKNVQSSKPQLQIQSNLLGNLNAFGPHSQHLHTPQQQPYQHVATPQSNAILHTPLIDARNVAIAATQSQKMQRAAAGHRRTQSKSQYAPLTQQIIAGQQIEQLVEGDRANLTSEQVGSEEDLMMLLMGAGQGNSNLKTMGFDYQQKAAQNLHQPFINEGNKMKVTKILKSNTKMSVENNRLDTNNEESGSIESRNMRVKLNSVKTDTHDKRSMEKIKLSHLSSQLGANLGDSTDDILSNKQSTMKSKQRDRHQSSNFTQTLTTPHAQNHHQHFMMNFSPDISRKQNHEQFYQLQNQGASTVPATVQKIGKNQFYPSSLLNHQQQLLLNDLITSQNLQAQFQNIQVGGKQEEIKRIPSKGEELYSPERNYYASRKQEQQLLQQTSGTMPAFYKNQGKGQPDQQLPLSNFNLQNYSQQQSQQHSNRATAQRNMEDKNVSGAKRLSQTKQITGAAKDQSSSKAQKKLNRKKGKKSRGSIKQEKEVSNHDTLSPLQDDGVLQIGSLPNQLNFEGGFLEGRKFSQTNRQSQHYRYDSVRYGIDGDLIDFEIDEDLMIEKEKYGSSSNFYQDFEGSGSHMNSNQLSGNLINLNDQSQRNQINFHNNNSDQGSQNLRSSRENIDTQEPMGRNRFKCDNSDYDEEEVDEEELKEEVGDLPPKIEDLQVEEYDDSEEMFKFGRGGAASGSIHSNKQGQMSLEGDEDDEINNDAPTVVIDDNSFCEKEIDSSPECNGENGQRGDRAVNSNIEFALRSIKLLEDEEEARNKKKKVTIISVEEEEDLIAQINDIRDRIKRGETVGQQKVKMPNGSGESTGVIGEHLNNRRLRNDFEEFNFPVQMNSHNNYDDQYYSSQGAGGNNTSNLQQKIQELQSHFKSVDDITHAGFISSNQTHSRQQTSNLDKSPSHFSHNVPKPPLYSLTFAHPHDPDKENPSNPLAGLSQKQTFHSIDQNAPTNCIIMDGPNIFEKKKQRYEKIQRMRGIQNPQGGTSSEVISQHKRSRDDTTPNGGVSSSASNTVPSSLKKSNENSSYKGSSISNIKVTKYSTSLTAQKSSTKKSKTNKSTVTKIQQTLKPLSQHFQAKSRQISNIHQLYQQNKGGVQSHEVVMMPLQTPNGNMQLGQFISKDEGSSQSLKRGNSKNKSTSDNQSSFNPQGNVLLYSLKKGTPLNPNQPGLNGHSAGLSQEKSALKKKIMQKTKKQLHGAGATSAQGESSGSQTRQIINNLVINIGQEQPVMIHSSSFKKMKTPKVKLADDLLLSQGHADHLHTNQFNLGLSSKKRMTEFNPQSLVNMGQLKMIGGQSVKNNSSTTSYKNPFFASLKLGTTQFEETQGALELGNVKSKSTSQNERRMTNQANQRIPNTLSNMQAQAQYKGHQINQGQVKQTAGVEKVITGVDPSFLTKLIKTKQETDNAFENLKVRLNGGSLLSSMQLNSQRQDQVNNAQGNNSSAGSKLSGGIQKNSAQGAGSGGEKNQFIEFEKKYKKLSHMISKILM